MRLGAAGSGSTAAIVEVAICQLEVIARVDPVSRALDPGKFESDICGNANGPAVGAVEISEKGTTFIVVETSFGIPAWEAASAVISAMRASSSSSTQTI